MFNKLFEHDNTIIIDETEEVVFKATQRKVHWQRPFHYGKDKDSMADSIIIESLINIKKLMNFTNNDEIYFISRNYKDFSEDHEKKILHKDILDSLFTQGLKDKIYYRLLFTKTLLNDFQEETNKVGLLEELELEADWEKKRQDKELLNYHRDMNRESVGLSSLSSDYEEKLAEDKRIHKFIDKLGQYQRCIYRV